jgi:hypothetical protein
MDITVAGCLMILFGLNMNFSGWESDLRLLNGFTNEFRTKIETTTRNSEAIHDTIGSIITNIGTFNNNILFLDKRVTVEEEKPAHTSDIDILTI